MLNGFFKPTPANLLKWSLALRGLIGTVATAAYVQDNPKIAFWVLIAGAVIDFVIQCQTDNSQTSFKSTIPILLIGFFGLMALESCRTTSTISNTEKTDSSWTVTRQAPVNVPGATSPSFDADSARKLIDCGAACLSMTGNIIYDHDTVKVSDTSGRAQLKFWKDAYGRLQAQCEAKAQQTSVPVNDSFHARTTKKTETITKYKTPGWVWWVVGVDVLIIVGAIIRLLWRKY